MSYLNWHVGMKVVCVDDQPRLTEQYPHRLKYKVGVTKGRVYTIRAIMLEEEGPGILLHEVSSNLPRRKNGTERPFFSGRFRPVQTRKTDISIFNRILLNPHTRISEDA